MRSLSALILVLSTAVAAAVAPNRVTSVTATPIANKAIRLTWQAPSTTGAPAATGYKVLRALTSDLTTTTDLTPTPITQLTFTDSSDALVAGTSYSYSIVALADGDAASPSDPVAAVPVDLPGAPGNLRVIKVTGNSITLSWNAVNEEGATYNVYRDGDSDPVGEDLTTTSFTDSGLTPETEYSYVVTVVTDGGESADSNEVTATTFGDGTTKQAAFAKRFRQIDIDASGLLSFDEYLAGHGARLAWVVIAHRFEYSDTDGSLDLSLAEYAKALKGRKFMSPSKPRQFFLADLDSSGELDEDEYPLIRPARTKAAALEKSFNKLDKDSSGGISPAELKIRNYAPPLE